MVSWSKRSIHRHPLLAEASGTLPIYSYLLAFQRVASLELFLQFKVEKFAASGAAGMRKTISLRKLLLPLVPLYWVGMELRELLLVLLPARRLRALVVSIGNLSTGGTGKTPLTIALVQLLASHGLRVDVLSRGYGRQSTLAVRVKPTGTVEEFGDEPLLIARATGVPVYVASERYEAGVLAEHQPPPAAGAKTQPQRPQIHLLDDGFQHRQLHRDVDIVLLNRADWRDFLLPAGDLREPRAAIHRATVIAIPAADAKLEEALRFWGWQGPIWRLHRKLDVPIATGPVAAFCGIARPEQFFAGLEAQGLKLAARLAFPDHFAYTAGVLENLLDEARAAGAMALVTTEKDLVRLGKQATVFPASMPLLTAHLRVEIEDQGTALEWLEERLGVAPVPTTEPDQTHAEAQPSL